MSERLKSPVVWTSCLALLAFIVKTWLGFEIPRFDTFTELVLAVLVAFGVVNNPRDRRHF